MPRNARHLPDPAPRPPTDAQHRPTSTETPIFAASIAPHEVPHSTQNTRRHPFRRRRDLGATNTSRHTARDSPTAFHGASSQNCHFTAQSAYTCLQVRKMPVLRAKQWSARAKRPRRRLLAQPFLAFPLAGNGGTASALDSSRSQVRYISAKPSIESARHVGL